MAVAFGNSGLSVDITSSGGITISSVISGNNGFTKTSSGSGVLTLSGANTYSGDTTISAGILALSGSGIIPSTSANIIIAGGAIFDVSGVSSSPFTLGSSQRLTGTNDNVSSATINGNLSLANGSPLSLAYSNGIPAFIITNGTLTLASGSATTITITNGGTSLPGSAAGTDYKLISKATSGNTGTVAGSAPTTVTFNGDGVMSGAAKSLVISGGELFLHVVTAPSAPTANAASSTNSTGFTASWNATSGALGYRLDVSTVNDFSSTVTTNADAGNATTFAVSGLSASTIYYYRVRATNSAGASVNSSTITVTTTTGGTAPSIAVQPLSQTNNYNTTAAFTVAASGDAPLSYQWRTNGVALADSSKFAGSAANSLSVSNVVYADTLTNLTVIITNAFGAVTSSIVTLAVNDPFIVTQPVSVTNAYNAAATTFSVTVAGSGAVTYQWRTNGVNIVNGGRFSGATSSLLSIANATGGDTNWSYTVAVSGAGLSVTSAVVLLTITNPPAFYRTAQSGVWSDPTTWQESTDGGATWLSAFGTPTSSDNAIEIRNGHFVTNVVGVTVDETTVDAGGQITISNGVALTLANGSGFDLIVNGTVLNQGSALGISSGATWAVNAGGTYFHNTSSGIATPLNSATLDPASTIIYRGSTSPSVSPTPTISGRNYGGNLGFESPDSWSVSQSGVSPLGIGGSFSIGTNGAGSVSFSLSFSGGIFVTNDLNIGSNGSLIATNTAITLLGNLLDNGTLALSSGNSFNFAGASKISGSSVVTFSNGFAVSAGKMVTLAQSIDIPAGKVGTVNGTLAGTGTIGASGGSVAVSSTGTVSPGSSSISTLTFVVAPTFGGTNLMEINRGASPNADKIVLSSGTLTYGGALAVNNLGTSLQSGDDFILYAAGAFSGWFSSVTLPALASGLSWDTNALRSSGVLTVYSFTTTPLALSTPSNTTAVISAVKLANHASSLGTPVATSVTTPSHGTAAVDGSGNLTYIPTSGYSGSDSFTLTFQDGHGSQTMAVSVTVGAGTGQSPNAVYTGTSGGNFVVRFAGIPGTSYTVETNSVIGPGWTKEGTYTAPGDNSQGFGIGVFQVSDPIGTDTSRYYRTVYPSY